jgi:hypothetical protein
MPQLRPVLAIATMALFLAACGGDDSPTDPGGSNNGNNDDTGGDTRAIKDNPSFATDIFEIFQRKGCTAAGCHGGAAGGLTLSSASGAYSALVGVASSGTGEILVIASDAANSYLVKKLEGTAGVGSRMPLGGTPLDNIDLTNVKNWINQGASNN